MKSRASYFSVSTPLVKENLRRFWAIPALSFLVYFFSGIFPILMSYDKLNNLSYYIQLSLKNLQPFYMFSHLIFPVITAVVIFRYLQGISSVAMMHSMPFTRQKLFNSNFLSGLILILAPIIMNGIILLRISKPVYNQYENGQLIEVNNLFSRLSIGNWIWESILIVLIIYSVSVFAGIVTGNSLMHFLTAGGFNFLIPGLFVIFIAYCSYFLYGFDLTGNWEEICAVITPYLNVIPKGGHFSIGSEIYYILLFIALYVITSILYSKRKLECATDTLTFKFMHPIISYLITFLGMTALGFYFYELENTDLYLYSGFAAGSIIFFIIGRMVILKSPRVFNLKSLRNFGIYAIMAVLFLVALNMDITGFEKRVPDTSKVKSFTISQDFGYSWGEHPIYGYSYDKPIKLKNSENVQAIIAFHQSLINNHKNLLSNEDDFKIYFGILKHWNSNIYTIPIAISYHSNSMFDMSRHYNVDYDFFKSSPDMKQIYESKEYKNYYSLQNFKYKDLKGIYISNENLNSAAISLSNQEEISQFMDCLEKDYQNQTFEEMISLRHHYATVSIDYIYVNSDPDKGRLGEISDNMSYEIGLNYTNTINWLRDHGYASFLEENLDNIESITLYHHVDDSLKTKQEILDEKIAESKTAYNKNKVKTLIVNDPAKIKALFDSYETTNTNNLDTYHGKINFKSSAIKGASYSDKMLEKYGTTEGPSIYFNGDNVPQYVLDYFK